MKIFKKTVCTDSKKIDELLSRGVDEVIDRDNLRTQLISGKQLRIKLGIDPTSSNIHIGRSVPLLKLRDFQELGHQIVLIIGDATGVIGDTSDKDSERPMLSSEIIKKNLTTYKKQAGKILDMKKVETYFNSSWLNKLNFTGVGELANNFSLAEFISRDNIRRRLDAGTRVSLREVLYPLMQGYDSVAISADVEIGGMDQRFNLLAGRTLQAVFKQKPQNILMGPIVEGLDGRKMSSSYGNTVNFEDTPNDMFGKIMGLRDDLIVKYFLCCTRIDIDMIEMIKERLDGGENPKDLKMDLAHELVRMYHGEKEADVAQKYFVTVFSERSIPENIPEMKVENDEYVIEELVFMTNLTPSKNEARRLIEQGGVKINEIPVTSRLQKVLINTGDVLQIGKRRFVRLIKK